MRRPARAAPAGGPARPELPFSLRLAGFLGALVLVAVGVALMIRAELGVAPYDVLVTGAASTVGWSVGRTAMVVPLLFVAGGLVLGGRPGVGTVLATLVVGPILDVVLDALPTAEAMRVRLPFFALGLLSCATGVAGVVAARVGTGPVELLMMALHDRGIPLARVRTGIEAGCVLTGFALGGQVGLGTLVVALSLGPLLNLILRLFGHPKGPVPAALPA